NGQLLQGYTIADIQTGMNKQTLDVIATPGDVHGERARYALNSKIKEQIPGISTLSEILYNNEKVRIIIFDNDGVVWNTGMIHLADLENLYSLK
ncbi:MAG: hypothetical protein ACE5FY_07975, partial [Nitrospiria bacterium]